MMLRQLINIPVCFFIAVLVLSGCSDGNEGDKYQEIQTIRIVSSDLSVNANGGTREIKFSSKGKISAVSKADWLTITAQTDTAITVQIAQNPNLESRNTQLVLSDGITSLDVPVMQEGFVFSYDTGNINHTLPYVGGTVSVDFTSNMPYTVTIPGNAQSWLSYKEEDGKLVFTVSPDAGKTPRGADVTVASNGKKITYNISQVELSESDLKGQWTWAFTDSQYGPVTTKVNLSPTDGEYRMLYGSLNDGSDIYFPLTWSASKGALVFTAGQIIAQHKDGPIATFLSNGSSVNTKGSFTARPIYRNGQVLFQFYNSNADGNVPDVTMLGIGLFSNGAFSQGVAFASFFTLSKAIG